MNQIVDGQPVREPPIGTPQFEYADRIPIEIRRGGVPGEGPDTYSVKLAGIEELGMHLRSGGVKVEFRDEELLPSQPTITLTFAPDATDLNLDAALIGYLRAKDAASQKPGIVNHSCGCGPTVDCDGC